MKGYLYILQSIKNGQYYIGCSENVSKRLKMHNSGNVKATKYKRPYKIVFVQEFCDIESARKCECKLKRMKRRDYLEKIIEDGRIKTFRPVAQR